MYIDGSLNFLDLNISISYNSDNNFVNYRLYDKRNDYSIYTHRIFSWYTCLHKNIKQNVILNYLQRSKRLNTCTNIMDSNVCSYLSCTLKKDFPFKFMLTIVSNYFKIDKIECVNRFLKLNNINS